MTSIEAIIRQVEGLAGCSLRGEEGLQHGAADRLVKGVTVAWMPSPDAIEAAGKAGHDLLIGHETLYHPYNVILSPKPPQGWREWPANRGRRELLDRYGLSFVRLHHLADSICIADVFGEQLGLGEPVYSHELFRVHEIEPCPLRDLIARVKQRLGMPAVRVALPEADRENESGRENGKNESSREVDLICEENLNCEDGLNRKVHRIGLPFGGLGLFPNVKFQQALVEQGCDVFIAGESDNMGFRFAVESGIPMIETSHEISENEGLRRFTQLLADAFPDVEFRFYENPCVWQMM